MSDIIGWLATHIEVWRPAAVMALASIAGGALYLAALSWGER